jgi:hypothetical protein
MSCCWRSCDRRCGFTATRGCCCGFTATRGCCRFCLVLSRCCCGGRCWSRGACCALINPLVPTNDTELITSTTTIRVKSRTCITCLPLPLSELLADAPSYEPVGAPDRLVRRARHPLGTTHREVLDVWRRAEHRRRRDPARQCAVPYIEQLTLRPRKPEVSYFYQPSSARMRRFPQTTVETSPAEWLAGSIGSVRVRACRSGEVTPPIAANRTYFVARWRYSASSRTFVCRRVFFTPRTILPSTTDRLTPPRRPPSWSVRERLRYIRYDAG